MLKFSTDAIRVANSSESLADRMIGSMWNNPSFALVRNQYERMLQNLPESLTKQWKDEVGVSDPKETEDEVMTEAEQEPVDESGGEESKSGTLKPD
jgi:hypothetical protein